MRSTTTRWQTLKTEQRNSSKLSRTRYYYLKSLFIDRFRVKQSEVWFVSPVFCNSCSSPTRPLSQISTTWLPPRRVNWTRQPSTQSWPKPWPRTWSPRACRRPRKTRSSEGVLNKKNLIFRTFLLEPWTILENIGRLWVFQDSSMKSEWFERLVQK